MNTCSFVAVSICCENFCFVEWTFLFEIGKNLFLEEIYGGDLCKAAESFEDDINLTNKEEEEATINEVKYIYNYAFSARVSFFVNTWKDMYVYRKKALST